MSAYFRWKLLSSKRFCCRERDSKFILDKEKAFLQTPPYFGLKSVKWLLLHQKGYFHLRQKINDCCYPIYKLTLVKILPTPCIEYTVSSIELLMTKQLFVFCCQMIGITKAKFHSRTNCYKAKHLFCSNDAVGLEGH